MRRALLVLGLLLLAVLAAWPSTLRREPKVAPLATPTFPTRRACAERWTGLTGRVHQSQHCPQDNAIAIPMPRPVLLGGGAIVERL
jgi:hypothetical protein